MRFDLHIHSCLSPCASLEMAPSAIARTARERGLGGIAIADHNSARNAQAFATCCAREGVAALFGLEVCTAEEVHALTIFDTVEQAMAMTAWVYDALVKRVNQPEVFGDQPVVDADDNIEELEWRMLGFATRRTVYEVGEHAHALGGLVVASHVDRPSFSAFSQLGVLSGDEGFDAMELSRTADESRWRERTGAMPLVRSSDSHLLADLGLVWTEADLAAFTVAELRRVFREGATTLSPPLTRF
ncbi:MAG: PHP domain-containing protein [Kiritimatiellae bacterium]|nr:PHP domain-containing protein [Kiritimatiellia bacterium]